MSSEIFEAGMLLCFGCSWPMNITKSIRAKTAKGKAWLLNSLCWWDTFAA